jgi:hypothetical protein
MGKADNQNQSRWPRRLVYWGAHCQRVEEVGGMRPYYDDVPNRPENPLAPARGCMWGIGISLGIYALATAITLIIIAVTP